ncbi:MAG TPA: hypothetical protein VGK73_31525 [Polyangiaceae bacterium]
MTNEQARWIRVLRVNIGCTFGRIAELTHIVDPKAFPGTNTLAGRNQCEIAAHVLGEDIADWEEEVPCG